MGTERAASPALMTVDEFFAWAEDQTGRYELEDGRIVAMAPERIRHAEFKAAAYVALRTACRQSGGDCRPLMDGAAVRVNERVAYIPDAMVYCGPRLDKDLREVPEPVIIVEVLSPSTAYRDIGVKLAGYFGVGSVAHYLIVDPDKPILIHHARGEGGLILTRLLTEGRLHLDPPGLDLAVEDLFGEPDM